MANESVTVSQSVNSVTVSSTQQNTSVVSTNPAAGLGSGGTIQGSLSITQNLDVDGILETDALTINGVTLAETIEDTIGAMMSGNTEEGIAVTYVDDDGKINFSVATQSDQNFTAALKDKLDNIEAGATADQTAAEIRTLVDSANDSNVFTDSDLSKLTNIEDNATADQTAAEIRTLVDSANDSNVFTDADHTKLDGIATGADVTPSWVPSTDPDYATETYVDTAVSNLVDSAPETLDTLNELAAALGDDANFATTVGNNIATKLPLAGGTMSGDINMGGNAITNVGNVDGRDVSADGSKLDGIEAGADVTPAWVPETDPVYITGNQTITLTGDVSGSGTTSIAVTIADDSHNHIISNVDGLQVALDGKSDTSHVHSNATTSVAGFMSTTDKSKLDGIEAGADVTPTWVPDADPEYISGNQTITLSGDVSGSGTTSISVTIADDSHNHIISNVDGLQVALDGKSDTSHVHSNATTSVAGFMSTTDKSKLDGIEDNADVTPSWVPDADPSYISGNQTITLSGDVSGSGTTSISVTIADDSHNHIISNVDGLQDALDAKSDTTHIHSDATTSSAGFMSTSDKSKLDNIEANATADQTAAEIRTLVDSATDSNVFTDDDHSKLDGIEAGADVTPSWVPDTDPSYISGNQTITLSGDVSGSGTTSISVTIADDSHNHIISNVDGLQTALDGKSDTSHVHSNATTSVAGFMSTTDKSKLDGISAGADVTPSWVPSADPNYATESYVDSEVTSAVSSLVDSAPTTLDTLNELAAALGDDANFATTVGNNIASKLPLAGGTMSGDINMGGNDITNSGEITATEFIGDLRGAVSFKAKAGEAISKGQPVYISGISGNTTVVSLADADDASKMPAFGIASEDASANSSVTVINFGSISNLSTSAYSEGDELFIATTAGGLTTVAPTGEGSLLQKIAKVTRSDNAAGSITVMGAGRTNAVPNLNEGNLFVGNASNQAVADDTLHVDIANTRLGVGTTPSYTLDVAGTVRATAGILTGDLSMGSNDITNVGTVDGRDVSVDGAKLDTIEDNATADQTAAEIRTLVDAASDSNVFTDADHTKLDGIEAGADVTPAWVPDTDPVYISGNQTITLSGDVSGSGTTSISVTIADDSHNHIISNVDGLQTALDGKSDTSHIHSDATTSSAGFMSTSDKSKLDNIEAGATADQTAAEIRTLVGSATDSNVFTDDDHSKLDGIEAGADVTPSWVPDADPSYISGNQTITLTGDVSGSGTTSISVTIADDSHNHVISNVDGLQTALDGKSDTSHVHSNATTSVAGFMSTTDKSKLDNIEAGATGDQTAAEIRTLVGSATDSNVFTDADHSKLDGISAGADVTPSWVPALDPTYATESYVDTEISSAVGSIIDSAPGALDTLNELAAALGDDANFATTVGNNIASKLSLAGGTMSGDINMGTNDIINVGTVDGRDVSVDGSKLDGIEAGADVTPSWVPDADPSYISGNQTITLTGDVSGSGTTSISVTIADDSHNHIISNVDGLQTALDGKSDTSHVHSNATTSVAGFMSTTDKSKLDNIEAGATGDQTAAEIRTLVGSATDSNVFTDDDHSKLDGIEAGADVTPAWVPDTDPSYISGNQTITLTGDVSGSGTTSISVTIADDSHNHVISNIDGLQTALDGKSSTTHIHSNATTSSAGFLSASDKSKLDGIEAGATGDQTAAEIRTLVESATDSNVFTDADHSKLNAIEAGATADQTAAEIRTLVDSATDSNVFTDADHTKLDGIEAGADVTPTWVPDADPSYISGNQTITLTGDVSGSGTTSISVTIADDSHNHIISNIDGLQTALDGKSDTSHVHSNATTSVAGFMSTTDKSKLDNIEANATADQTAAEIRTLVGSATDSNVFTDADHSKLDGISAGADVTPSWVPALDPTYATESYVDTEISSAVGTLVDSAPGTLDTLNELAAALGDDANFSTTVTNSIATKLPLAGGTMSGDINMGTNDITNVGTVDGRDVSVDGSKLDGIEAGATGDQTAAEIRTLVESATDSNVFTDADHTKLNGIEAGADVTPTWVPDADPSYISGNQTITLSGDVSGSGTTSISVTIADDSHNHIISNVDGLQTALDGKSDTSHVHSNATTSVAGFMSTTDKSKLDNIEAGATGDQTAAEIRTLVGSATDSNVFTDADHSKLDGIEAGADVTPAWVPDADPSYISGNQTITLTGDVSGSGTTSISVTIADDSHNHIISNVDGLQTALDGKSNTTHIHSNATTSSAGFISASDKSKLDGIEAGATGDQTAAEIRTLVESATDSNVFTDADHSKLNGIEAGATADQTAAEIRTLVGSATDSNVFTDADHSKLDGISAGADVTPSWVPSTDPSYISGNQTITLTGDVSGSGTTSISVTIADDSHNHVISNVDGLQTALDGKSDTSHVHSNATTSVAGFMSTTDKSKLNGISAGADVTPSWVPSADPNYATESYVDTEVTSAVSSLIDSAPTTLDTLNELAAALGDDANFSTTITNSIATKLPLAGGTMSGAINMGGNAITNVGNVDGRDVSADGSKLDGIEVGATGDQTAAEIRTLVESATDSNVFTDADHSKLNGIEAGATADQTASEILSLIKTVDGSGSGLDADTVDGLNSGQFIRSDANDYVTGHITGSGSPQFAGFFMPQNPEGNHVKAPWFFNDMAYARLRGATVSVTVTGGSSPSNSNIDAMLDASTGFWNLATSGVTEVVITMSNLPKTMYHGSHMGVTFGNTTWRAKNVKLESYYNGQWNELVDLTNQSYEYVTASYNSGSNGQSQLRWTFSNFNTTSMRIVSLFAYNYNATGMPSLYLTKDGGEMYGDITMSGSQTVDGRDLSVDGAKLDNIEAGATADQTAAEIRTLVESATDSNVFTDADHSKLNGIEAGADVTPSWVPDADPSYISGNQTITLTGDVSGSGTTSISVTIADDSHNHVISNIDGLQTALDGKSSTSHVHSNATTSVAGFMSTTDKSKLDNIEAGATGDQTAAEIRTLVESATDSNVFTDADHSKLNGIAANANNYSLPAATSSVRGGIELNSDTVQTVSANSVSTTSGRTYGIQVNSAGQAVVNVPWSDTNTTYSVGDGGLTQKNFTTTLYNKLVGIEDGATGDQTAAEIRTLVESATDSNVFTDADHTKLNGIAANANNYSLPAATSSVRGGIELGSDTVQSVSANSVSTTSGRTYGIQVNSAGQAVVNVPWSDTNTTYSVGDGGLTQKNFTTTLYNKLVGIEAGATGDQTAAEIRTLVESASDSNVFTDADHTKLNGITAPNAPTNLSCTVVGETIDVTFDASTTSDIDAYLVYSSVDGSDYGLISVIPPDDFSATMSIIDAAFTVTGTQAYRVYAMKYGILSSAATASVSYTVSSAEPTDMSVVNLNNAYYVQWNPPSSNERFVTAYNVYKHEASTTGGLSQSSASLVYSGMNTNFMYKISGSNNNNYHQFWVETTVA
jgi:hypothetical protein